LTTRTKIVMRTIFLTNLMVITLVSAYDCHLTLKYKSSLPQLEENPVARSILAANHWQVEPFIAAKAFGTFTVIFFLMWLYRFRKSSAFMAAFGVAGWQIFLMAFYLGVSDIMLM
jgi:hypothetical protein